MKRAAVGVATFALAAASCSADLGREPICSQPDDPVMVLEAQSVPTATHLPCLAELPIGWTFSGILVDDTGTTLWLDHDRAGFQALEVELTTSCDTSAGVEVPPSPDELGMLVYQAPTSLDPYTGSRSLTFEGGCIVYRYRFAQDSEPALVTEADRAVSSVSRASVVSLVERDLDLSVCGASAPDCAG